MFTELLTDYTLALYASEDYLDAHGEPANAEDLNGTL